MSGRQSRARRAWSALALVPLAAGAAPLVDAAPAGAEQTSFTASGQESLTFTTNAGFVVTCTASWSAFRERHDELGTYKATAFLSIGGGARCLNNVILAGVTHRPSGDGGVRVWSQADDTDDLSATVNPSGTVTSMEFSARFDNCASQRCWMSIVYTAPK